MQGQRNRSGGLSLLIYDALRNPCQRFVGSFFLIERLLQQGNRIIETKLLGPSAKCHNEKFRNAPLPELLRANPHLEPESLYIVS